MLTRTLFAIALVLNLTGCGTVTPTPVMDNESSIDSTIPQEYDPDAGWLLDFKKDEKGRVLAAVITNGARDRYNALISDYREQFRERYKVSLVLNAGILPFVDQYGNELWLIDAEHLEYFARLSGWAKDRLPADSVWMKLKGKLR